MVAHRTRHVGAHHRATARFAAYVRCAPSDVLILADERRAAIEARGVAVLLDRVSATEAMARGHALVSAATLAEFFAPR